MKTLKNKLVSAGSAFACLAATYIVLQHPAFGMWAWFAGLPAATVVAATALVRGNEIPVEVDSWRSHLRRAGFFFAGIWAVSFIIRPLANEWPSWYSLLGLWGIAATWVTTPNMPPWWDYITGKKKLRKKDIV